MYKLIKAEIYKYMLEIKNYYPDYISEVVLTIIFFLYFSLKLI